MNWKSVARDLLPPVVVRTLRPPKPAKGDYLSAADTVAAAEAAGLSVCEYVERFWGIEGQTAGIVARMPKPGGSVVEIGAGTGRYIDGVIANAKSYQVYETAEDWRQWLAQTYKIDAPIPDGATLKDTPTNSVDLVHAHGVFVYLRFLDTYSYFREIFRVVKPGGYAVFNFFSETSFTEELADKWLASDLRYPAFLSKPYVINLFAAHGFEFRDSFTAVCGEGFSEYVVLHRTS